jgi:hypothetical protein
MDAEIHQTTPEPKQITRPLSAPRLLDLFDADAIIDEPTPISPDVWPECPWHGPHEANAVGRPLYHCERCAKASI